MYDTRKRENMAVLTRPNTVCLLSSQGVGTVVMKNWLPFVLGPLLAMETMPRLLCFKLSIISSSNLPFAVGKMLLPPRPVPAQALQNHHVLIE